MIQNHKLISLAIIGVVAGGIVGALVNVAPNDIYSLAAVGGIVGFLAGWVWNARSGGIEN